MKSRFTAKRTAIIVITTIGLIAIGLAPWLIGTTSLRDAVLQSIIGDPNLIVSSRAASFGWLSPLVIDDLSLKTPDGDVQINVARLRAQRSWLSLWLSSPEIGRIEVDQPNVKVIVDDAEQEAVDDSPQIETVPTISVALRDGTLLVRERGTIKPAIDAAGIDVNLHTEQRSQGSVLIIEPIALVQRAVVSPEACDEGLQLVAPHLANEVSLQGEYSVQLTKMHLALGASEGQPNESRIEGVVTLHHATAQLKNELTRRLAIFAAELLDLGDVPDQIRVTEEAELVFQFTERQITHEGMAMFFPDVLPGLTIRTNGSVALDESLDIDISLQIPVALLGDNTLARQLATSPLELRVFGTIDAPRLELPEEQAWMTHIRQRLTTPEISAAEKELADRVMETLAGF